LNLPLDLLSLYSQEYGRYSYAMIDDRGKVLFSSQKDHTALFPDDSRPTAIEFLQQRRGDATVSGASVRKIIGGQTVWIQAGEDPANRDVLIDDIVADFYRNVGCKNVALLGTTEPVWVKGNPEMLSHAILNLTENALNHTAPGSTVEFVVEDDGTVSVLDHGPGIADDERNLFFQRFWRRDRRKVGSTGLGLSIVQRIAELHSATITFKNRPSRGAQISIRFLATCNTADNPE
jgi:signal transduction histidine kinase